MKILLTFLMTFCDLYFCSKVRHSYSVIKIVSSFTLKVVEEIKCLNAFIQQYDCLLAKIEKLYLPFKYKLDG